jgi:hypothetical protein
MPDLYGVTTNAFRIEEAALATLKAWLPAHCAHQERANDLDPGTLPVPQEFPTASELDLQAHQRLPAVIVVSPGSVGTPEQLTNGTYRAQYRLEVAVATAGRTEHEVRRDAALYIAAVRGALVQNSTLGGVVEKTTWIGQDDHAVAGTPVGREQRAIYATAFAITVRDLVNRDAGPVEPPADPNESAPPSPALTVTVVAQATEPQGPHQ